MKNLPSGLISSKTRIKLPVRLFLRPKATPSLYELAKKFNVSTNSVREELNQITNHSLLMSLKKANLEYLLFPKRYIKRKIRHLVLTGKKYKEMLPKLKKRARLVIGEQNNRVCYIY